MSQILRQEIEGKVSLIVFFFFLKCLLKSVAEKKKKKKLLHSRKQIPWQAELWANVLHITH